MNETTRRKIAALALIATLAVAAAGPTFAQKKPATPTKPEAPVIVFAAASLKTALDEIAAAFEKQTGNKLSISYGSSATLAKQIEQAAPADVFISANTKWMDYLDKAKAIKPSTRRDLLGNELVLIEPADLKTEAKIEPGFDLAGLTGDGKIAVCTIASCPAGIYAKESLGSLGIWSAVEPKLAQAENVRAALALVSRGEARFGIVYDTDAKADPGVRVVGTFPAKSHEPIVYPVALVATSTNPAAPKALAFLSSQAATKILLSQGFTILSK
jgi:molybdate transport system substrate-binding protein